MNADLILQKGRSGEMLSAEEMKALMMHAIEILDFIKSETLASIEQANDLLAKQFKAAA